MPSSEDAKKKAEELKNEGNKNFGEGKPEAAVTCYTKGLELDPTSHVLMSNRAAAYLRLNNLKEAVKDAKACVKQAPEWPKGYTRLAQSLFQMGMYDDCDEAINTLEKLESDNRNIERLRSLVKKKRTFMQLSGKWYGTVSKELGGYIQTFDFKSETEVIVSVFGRDITARLNLNTVEDPMHLDLLVEPAPGSPPAPEVKHIFYIDEDDVLHLCSPYMTPPEVRPTKFEGPAYVQMRRGSPPADNSKKEKKAAITKLSSAEKCLEFAKAVTEILPDQRISPLQSDSEEAQANMMQQNIQFQTAYFNVKELYGADVESDLREYLERTKTCPSDDLKNQVDAMRRKMQVAGLYPEDSELPTPAAEPTSTPTAAPAVSSAKTEEPTPGNEEEVKSTAKAAAQEPAKAIKDNSNTILAVGLVAAAAAVVAIFALRKKD
ncbi:Small glutamine-rich tetratricopeptide repeat-containing protein [Hondaea fermentalgiana]|uniref:Small glutamine-rich tetratricopeptide repeat-containing protein n=1 Tax=Hondaea fermentalgiana TaxID=2315210 RepID=A0A2R5G954_9STRA|nr:Small glutamine-rich tetratricopeptide repeat-containing protein [Hondaea fermentalgiana]|eukprot:GBG27592.1 Small glutamine-rich tetratricopeptide repeat-containing protein [Hondaea fermentalgiana]